MVEGRGRGKIISDFRDYYDEVYESIAEVDYFRKVEKESRIQLLNELSYFDIDTIKISSLDKVGNGTDKVVVYTDSTEHGGRGKHIMGLTDVKLLYRNKPVSKYYNTNNRYVKVINIGKLRFRIDIELKCGTLEDSKVLGITELTRYYDNNIRLPIFSIDYINVGGRVLATDFNKVERLSDYGFSSVIDSCTVANEVNNAIIHYRNI